MFHIERDHDGTLHFAGRLDASQSDNARSILDGVDESATADFSKLEYISSAGIGVILGTYKRLLDSGHALRIVNVTPRIANVFRYAGLSTLLGIESDSIRPSRMRCVRTAASSRSPRCLGNTRATLTSPTPCPARPTR